MHIAMVTDFYWPLLGGVEQHVRSLSHQLVDRGHRVTVITLGVDGHADAERDGGVDVIRIRSSTQRLDRLFGQSRPWAPPIHDPAAVRAIRRVLAERDPDVVHIHDWLGRSALGATSGVPVVATLHYYTLSCAKKNLMRGGAPCPGPAPLACARCAADHYGPVKGLVTAAANACGAALERRTVDRFIAVSTATALGNGLHPDDVEVIPNFLPPTTGSELDDADLARLAQLPDEPFFLYVGDFRPVKGFDVLLEAYTEADTDRPLVVIGKRWAEHPFRAPVGAIVLEEWPNPAVLAAFERAWVTIVPSVWSEPFGLVAIESLAAGTPVIASRTGGLVDIVTDDVVGRLVSPGSKAELRDALNEIDRDIERRGRWSEQAVVRAERFTAVNVVPRIEAVYRSVMER